MKRIAMQIAAVFGAVAMFVGSARAADYTLERDEEWLNGRELSGTIDLNGHKLTVNSLTGDATIMSSADGAELHVNVASGETANSTVAISGPVCVVKEGAGTFIASMQNQTYTGGTDVKAGTFRCGTDGKYHIYGVDGSMVTVREGAIFDCDGWADHSAFKFVLDGGTVKSVTNRNRAGSSWFADVTLTKDSIMTGQAFGFVGAGWAESHLQMNGHRLTVDVSPSQSFFIGNLKVEGGGEIYARTGGYFAIGGNPNGGRYVKAETTTLHVGGAAIYDGGGEHVFGSYVSEYTGGFDVASTPIKVLDRFTPEPGTQWHATELQNGATLDLSGHDAAWNVTCNFSEDSSAKTATATFAAGAMIVVDPGERELADEMKLVGWTDADSPVSVSFKFPDEIGKGFMFQSRSDGLYVLSAVAAATWTGTKSSNCADPANWTCYDADGNVIGGVRPGSITAVTVSDEVLLDIPANSLSCASFTCKNVSLKGDCDWSGLGQSMNGTIDLAGHKLSVNGLACMDAETMGANLIANGDFESTTIPGGGSWGYIQSGDATSSNWNYDGNYSGFTKANTTWTSDVKGTYSAFIQGGGDLWQTVKVTEAGDYALSYSYKCRLNYGSHNMQVVVDGVAVTGGQTSSAAGWAVNTVVLNLTAGEHKIQFQGLAGSATVFDDLSLRKYLIVTDTMGANYVANGDFESTTIPGGGSWGYIQSGDATSSNWNYDGNYSGFTKANTTWTSDVKGTYSAFIQGGGDLWQTVKVTEAGDYALSYSYKCRLNYGSHNMQIEVDGVAVTGGQTSSAAGWAVNTVVLNLTAGDHKIQFKGLGGSATIFDDVSLKKVLAPGELHVVVSEGQTTENATVAITGHLRFVKEGAGTFIASKVNQTYTGGTDVKAGTFRCGEDGKNHIYGVDGSTVTVREDATFDCDGWADHSAFKFVLDGGTVKSVTNRGKSGSSWFADVTLTKDSLMTGYGFGFVGAGWAESHLQMNGHRLTVDVSGSQSFFVGNLKIEGGGEIYARAGGYFAISGNPKGGKYIKAETTTLRVGGAAIQDYGGEHVFGSYVSEYTGGFDVAGTAIKVLDRFEPGPGAQWHATELQNGATLDLSGHDAAWNVTCNFSESSSTKTATATFAAGATIFVDLGERKVKSSEPLVQWTEKPENVEFCLAPGMKGWLEAKDDGLYRYTGFGIIVR